MPLNLPATGKEISQKSKVDVKRELQQSDPFVARSYLGAIISSISNRVFEFYAALVAAELEANPFTAIRNLVRWASVWGVTRLAGQVASGTVFVDASQTGVGVLIPSGTEMASSDGATYTTQGAVTLAAGNVGASTNLTQTGGVAIFTAASDHNFASNALITISGLSQSGYNLVDAVITVTGLRTFTYEVNPATASPSTGGPGNAAFAGASIAVNASDSGSSGNLSADAELAFFPQIDTVEAFGQITFGEVTNGIDIEADDALRKRLLDRIQNPVTPFNVANITAVAREESGVTRVFVQEKTPAIGQVTIFFMRDNDDNPIPIAQQVTDTKARILGIKPADISDADVIVAAPTGLSTDFTFAAISPDTPTMRTAVTAALTDFFDQTPQVGVTVVEDAYRSVIFGTVDPATGIRVASFTLSLPTQIKNAQDESLYNNSPTTEGTFDGGSSGHSATDVLTMSDGSLITVDAVSAGVVTQFTVDATASRGSAKGVDITMVSTDGSGDDFTLTPDTDNMELTTDLFTGAGEIRTLGTVAY